MRGLMALTVVTGSLILGLADPAQAQYHRYYGYRGFGYGGYGGFSGGMTPALGAGIGMGAEATGMGNFASGLGQYQVSNQKAQLIHQQVVAEYLQNQRLKLDTHFKNQADIEAHQKVELQKSAEYAKHVQTVLRQIEQMEAPHRLSDEQFDRAHSLIYWPHVLRAGEFAESRLAIDKLFHDRSPGNSGDGSDIAVAIDKACTQMMDIVKANIHQLEPVEYITAKHFLASLAYEAKFAVK